MSAFTVREKCGNNVMSVSTRHGILNNLSIWLCVCLYLSVVRPCLSIVHLSSVSVYVHLSSLCVCRLSVPVLICRPSVSVSPLSVACVRLSSLCLFCPSVSICRLSVHVVCLCLPSVLYVCFCPHCPSVAVCMSYRLYQPYLCLVCTIKHQEGIVLQLGNA